MTDNLLLGPDAQLNHMTAMLRDVAQAGTISAGAALGPQAFLAIDPQSKITGTYSTGNGRVLELKYDVQVAARWFALHLPAGKIDLTSKAVFGVVCKSQAPVAMTTRICVRSARPGGFVDTFFDKHMLSYAQASTHIDVMQVQVPGTIPLAPVMREVILFFQTKSAEIDIQDMRFFVV